MCDAPVSYLDENGADQSCNDYEVVTANDTQWTDGWYVARGDITIDQSVTVSGNVHLILEDGCNLTVNGGILLQSGSNMYIYHPLPALRQSTDDPRQSLGLRLVQKLWHISSL